MNFGVLDIETAGEPWSGQLLCVGWKSRAYVPGEPGWDELLADLRDDTVAKVVFTKYDHRWLRLHGIAVAGPIIDVQVMAWAVDERTPLDLEWCANKYCGIVMDKRISSRGGQVVFQCDDGTVVPIAEAPTDQMCRYNERDLEATHSLFMELRRRLAYEEMRDYYEQDALPLTEVLLDMEVAGLPFDVAATEKLRDKLAGEIADLERQLISDGGLPDDFKLSSSQQLGRFLYSRSFEHKRSVKLEQAQIIRLKQQYQRTGSAQYGTLEIDKVGREYVHGRLRVPGLGLRPHGRTDAGAPRTDAPTLRVHYGDHPWVSQYLEHAKRVTVVKFLTAWLEQEVGGRLFGRFNQTGTKTGRLSSSGPNLQNVPSRGAMGREVRSLFRPESGHIFIHGDYSQLEPRLMAHFSGDPVLRGIYEDDADIYLVTAMRVFGCSLEDAKQYRNAMKTYVLALGYGSGAKTLKTQLAEAGQTVPLAEVEDTLASLKRVYSVFFDWKESVISDAANEGYVETLAGHRRHFGGRGAASWKDQGQDERQAVNAVIQGSAADIVARAMLQVHKMPGATLLAQVHDELLIQSTVETAPPLGDIQRACEVGHGFDLAVPLAFEPRVIPTWAEGKD